MAIVNLQTQIQASLRFPDAHGFDEIGFDDTYGFDSYTIALGVGTIESLASSIVSVSSLTSEITLGQEEPLASAIAVSSSIISEITLGQEEPLASSIIVNSSVTSALTIGREEPLLSSIITQGSNVTALLLGGLEPLASSITVLNTVNSTLGLWFNLYPESIDNVSSIVSLLGLDLSLASSILCESSVSTDMCVFFKFVSSINVDSIIDSSLTLGREEPLETIILVESTLTSALTLGREESLLSSIITQGSTVTALLLGTIESLETVVAISSSLTSALTLGREEALETIVLVESNLTSEITLGRLEPCSTSIESVSSVEPLLTITYALVSEIEADSSFNKAFLYKDEYYTKVLIPLYKYMLPNLYTQSSQFNNEFYNIYNILTALYNGNIVHGKYVFTYNTTLDTLDVKYKENIIARVDNKGNLKLAGTIGQNKTLLADETVEPVAVASITQVIVTSALTVV